MNYLKISRFALCSQPSVIYTYQSAVITTTFSVWPSLCLLSTTSTINQSLFPHSYHSNCRENQTCFCLVYNVVFSWLFMRSSMYFCFCTLDSLLCEILKCPWFDHFPINWLPFLLIYKINCLCVSRCMCVCLSVCVLVC